MSRVVRKTPFPPLGNTPGTLLPYEHAAVGGTLLRVSAVSIFSWAGLCALQLT
jgi:hypothetical protein